jgi:hypothetical protein
MELFMIYLICALILSVLINIALLKRSNRIKHLLETRLLSSGLNKNARDILINILKL